MIPNDTTSITVTTEYGNIILVLSGNNIDNAVYCGSLFVMYFKYHSNAFIDQPIVNLYHMQEWLQHRSCLTTIKPDTNQSWWCRSRCWLLLKFASFAYNHKTI